MKKILIGLLAIGSISALAYDRSYTLEFRSGIDAKSHPDETYSKFTTSTGIKGSIHCSWDGGELSIRSTNKIPNTNILSAKIEDNEKCEELINLIKNSAEIPLQIKVRQYMGLTGEIIDVNTKH
ncbi:MAG: hypothetical protein JNM93_06190 [Bacteriovoracaceae bacterium]|nr:hypothetical protein [Bacteriovoracaceae bacterium]